MIKRKKQEKKQQTEKQQTDLYGVTIAIISSVAEFLGIPSFFVNMAIQQIQSMPREQLKKILKIIWKSLKPYAGELDD